MRHIPWIIQTHHGYQAHRRARSSVRAQCYVDENRITVGMSTWAWTWRPLFGDGWRSQYSMMGGQLNVLDELVQSQVPEYSNESTQSVRQIRTRSVGVQTEVRRRHDGVPLMSIRCRRPRQGLLGSGPVSITRIQQHGRSQLRQSRH